MTIDEAIKKYKEKSEFFKKTKNVSYALELEQIMKWLKELKKLRQCTNIENREYPYFNGFKEGKQVGYNKAIDDLVKMAYDELLYNENLTEIDIDYIAEQLKAGGNDDD